MANDKSPGSVDAGKLPKVGGVKEKASGSRLEFALPNIADPPLLSDSNRIIETDKQLRLDLEGTNFSNRLFLRLVAKQRHFKNVDFKYSIFDTCYLRNCNFDSCDFTGCRFVATQLPSSFFIGCKFDYATFERTTISVDILGTGCPGTENLTAKFARTLRINFQQLGDAEAVNRAISLELSATKRHLEKAWLSGESYYRKKYQGLKRAQMFAKWLWFKIQDVIWGNGESIFKLAMSVAFVVLLLSPIDIWSDPEKKFSSILSIGQAISESFQVFLGVAIPTFYPKACAAGIALLRFIAFGLLVSIIVKRRNRR
jgi:uncharacterized protein YjbI with pentapeptide repeats